MIFNEVLRLLTREIADEIVKETMRRLNRNINIIDPSGTIIASGDPSRVNLFHEGGLHVIKTGEPLVITNQNMNQWKGSRLGINLPIKFQDKIVGVIGITGEQRDVEEFGDLVKMTTELMIKQSYMASQQEWRQRSKEEIFEELIKYQLDDEYIKQKLNLLDIKLQPPFHVFTIDFKEAKVERQLIIKKTEDIFNKNESLAGFLEISKMFILASNLSSKKALEKITLMSDYLNRLNIQYKIGYGTQTDEISSISVVYKESELALLIGDKKAPSFISYSDFETEALTFQLDKGLKERYLERVFPNLTTKTIETLQTFFDCNLNITETADLLYLHRNTLIYRLKKVKEQTGLDPQIFTDALTLQVAIWIFANK